MRMNLIDYKKTITINGVCHRIIVGVGEGKNVFITGVDYEGWTSGDTYEEALIAYTDYIHNWGLYDRSDLYKEACGSRHASLPEYN